MALTKKPSSRDHQFGGLGQTLDLVFLSPHKVELDSFRTELSKLNVTIKEASAILDWVEWVRPSGDRIILASNIHQGLWDKYWVELGLDSRKLRALASLEERGCLVDDFLSLGSELWNAYPFYEGIMASEGSGVLVSGKSKQQFRQLMMEYMGGSSYASFLSHEAAESIETEKWVPTTYPHASIQPLPRDGVLVIWDASMKGLAKFLFVDFGIS